MPAHEQVPAFGPGELYGEIDSAEKLVGEIDRQIRGNQGVRNVVRRHGASGSVSHEAGADLLDAKLDELKAEIAPVLERYGVSAEEGGAGGGGGPDDDLGEFGDHDEL